MLKKILYVLLAFILYFMISLIAGWGPYVDVSSHTQPGQEYPAPNEEQVAEETAALVLASIQERHGEGRMLRDAHPYAHGCVRGTFAVGADLPVCGTGFSRSPIPTGSGVVFPTAACGPNRTSRAIFAVWPSS